MVSRPAGNGAIAAVFWRFRRSRVDGDAVGVRKFCTPAVEDPTQADILFHDKMTSVAALKLLLPRLNANGFTLVDFP